MTRRHNWKPEERAAVRALRRKGLSLMEIARETGLSKSAIGRMTADMKADARAKANKLRVEQKTPPWLDEAQRMLSQGLSRIEIARRLAIPKSAVYRRLT